jgi:hypothetical protein
MGCTLGGGAGGVATFRAPGRGCSSATTAAAYVIGHEALYNDGELPKYPICYAILIDCLILCG